MLASIVAKLHRELALPWISGLIIASLFSWIYAFAIYGPALQSLFPKWTASMSHTFIISLVLAFLVINFLPPWIKSNLPGRVAATTIASILIVLAVWLPLPAWLCYFVLAMAGISFAYLMPALVSLFFAQDNPAICLAVIMIITNAVFVPVDLGMISPALLVKVLSILLILDLVLILFLPQTVSQGLSEKRPVKPDGAAVRGMAIVLLVFTSVFVVEEAIVYQTTWPAVYQTWPGAAWASLGFYALSVALLAVIASYCGYTALVGLSLSALGIGLTTFALGTGFHWLALISFFLQLFGLAGMDLFFWLYLWATARLAGTHYPITLGAIGYFVLGGVSVSVVNINWTGSLASEPSATITAIAVLFLAIPFVFHRSISAPLLPATLTPDQQEPPSAATANDSPQPSQRSTGAPSSGTCPPEAPVLSLLEELTPAEQRVFELLLADRRDLEIAEKLFISRHTVKFHVRNILRKTGARNRFELLAMIKKDNLLNRNQ